MNLWLAFKGLSASRGTTAMLVIAVALGTAFAIPNTANLDGLHDALLDDGLSRGAGDIRVEPRDRARFSDGTAITQKLRGMIDDGSLPARAVVPTLTFPGAIGGANTKFFGTAVIGVDPGQPPPYHVLQGQDLVAGPIDRGILVGATIAQRLNLKLGDRVNLRVLYGGSTALGDTNLGKLTSVVRGIVTSSNGAYRFVFVDRRELAIDAGTPDAASSISVHLYQHFAADSLAQIVAAAVPDSRAVSWRDDEPGFASYLAARDIIGAVSYAMVIAAIAIPMWALLYINILRRRRELAILRSLGFTRREVFAICVMQAMTLALIGAVVGAGLGYAAIRYFAANPLFEWESLSVQPVASVSTFVIPVVVVMLTSIVAALHPAWRASRVEPAAVLRRIE